MLQAVKLTSAYMKNPIGIGELSPSFGWVIDSDACDVMQKSYHIQVSLTKSFAEIIWDSGIVQSENSTCVPYAGAELQSATVYYWCVQITANHGEQSDYSETASFETGLIYESDWKAKFISPETAADAADSKGWMLRRTFTLEASPKKARIYATALGMYEIYINGVRIGEDLLTPGWTEYKSRLQHQTYDVTALLLPGENAIGIGLGAGWYKGDLAGWTGSRNHYGKAVAALAQLEVYQDNDKHIRVVTDENWKFDKSPVVYSELYHGEIYDARLEQDGWASKGFDDRAWRAVHVQAIDKRIIVPQDGEPIRRQERLKVQEIIHTPKGETVLDFGQNIAGWVRFTVCGNAGDKVILKHAEVLDQDGNFYIENMRGAKVEINYTLKGNGEETFEPHFTFQGFRYVRVESYPGEINPDNFEAIVIHSNMPKISDFKCSDAMLEQLHHNILWGLKGNFVDICTDCPQRDERLGWTGDAQVFARMATYLMDTRVFYRKWMRDVRVAQMPDGGIPYVVPDVLTNNYTGDREADSTDVIASEFEAEDARYAACGWGDVATILPWSVYIAYGDAAVLRENYPMMKKWVEYIRNVAIDGVLWEKGFHFGDWVALDAEEGSYFGATPNELIATAYYAYSTEILSKAAQVLGYEADANFYADLRAKIGKAYAEKYYTKKGFVAYPTQTAQIISLAFGLTPDLYRKNTVNTLLKLIQENGGHLTTGFLGTPYICHVLSENGELDAAYDLLLKKDYPSWLYQITKGATTIWEHWDGIKPDGSMWSPDMNSFNHYAYGAIGDWLYKVIAGIDTDRTKVGYKQIVFYPRPGGGITSASASIETPYGKASIAWQLNGRDFSAEVLIPHNTTALIRMPDGSENTLGSGKHILRCKTSS